MSDIATLPPEDSLKPARELAAANKARWTGESDDYRAARTALLTEEIELRRQIQRVAGSPCSAALPVAKDYRFSLAGKGSASSPFGRHGTFVLIHDVRAGARAALPDVHLVRRLADITREIGNRRAAIVARSRSRASSPSPRGRWRNLDLQHRHDYGATFIPDRRGRRLAWDGLRRDATGPPVLPPRHGIETPTTASIPPRARSARLAYRHAPGGRAAGWYRSWNTTRNKKR